MRFSLGLPFVSGGDELAEYDDLIALACHADHAGMDAVSTTDHPFPVVAPGAPGHHALDPFVLMGFIAAATEQTRLHFSLAVAGHRNPYLLARMVSTLDVLSHGRTIVALGAGYMAPELAALGARYEARGKQLDDQVEVLTAAWSGDPVHRAGEWPAEGNVMLPRPVQRPRPPLWRGGNTRTAMRSAVACFDGWSPFEVSAEASTQTATAALTIATLPERIREARDLRAAGSEDRPFTVCFVRTGAGWLRERTRAVEELHRLRESGLDWLELKVPGRSLEERCDAVDRVLALAEESGARAAAKPA